MNSMITFCLKGKQVHHFLFHIAEWINLGGDRASAFCHNLPILAFLDSFCQCSTDYKKLIYRNFPSLPSWAEHRLVFPSRIQHTAYSQASYNYMRYDKSESVLLLKLECPYENCREETHTWWESVDAATCLSPISTAYHSVTFTHSSLSLPVP